MVVSFSSLNSIPLYTYSTIYPPAVDGHLGCFWILTVMNKRTVDILEHGVPRRWLRLIVSVP